MSSQIFLHIYICSKNFKKMSLPLCPLLLNNRFFKLLLRGLCGSIHSSHCTICGQKRQNQIWKQRKTLPTNKFTYDIQHTLSLQAPTLNNYFVSVQVRLQLYCTCFSRVSGFIGTASCWLVIRAPCCHLLAVPLPVWLASCLVLHKETDNRITNILYMKRPAC